MQFCFKNTMTFEIILFYYGTFLLTKFVPLVLFKPNNRSHIFSLHMHFVCMWMKKPQIWPNMHLSKMNKMVSFSLGKLLKLDGKNNYH